MSLSTSALSTLARLFASCMALAAFREHSSEQYFFRVVISPQTGHGCFFCSSLARFSASLRCFAIHMDCCLRICSESFFICFSAFSSSAHCGQIIPSWCLIVTIDLSNIVPHFLHLKRTGESLFVKPPTYSTLSYLLSITFLALSSLPANVF